jgi:TonB family protein
MLRRLAFDPMTLNPVLVASMLALSMACAAAPSIKRSTSDAFALPPCNAGWFGVDTTSENAASKVTSQLKELGLFSENTKLVPYSTKPELANRYDVSRALVQNYPPDLRDRGIGGTTLILVIIDVAGNTTPKGFVETSGHVGLDNAAHKAAQVMKFYPATFNGCRVPTLAQLPIVFKVKSEKEPVPGVDQPPVR